MTIESFIQPWKSVSLIGATSLLSFTSLAQAQVKTVEKPASSKLGVEENVSQKASQGLGYLKGRELARELLKSGYLVDDYSVEDFQKGFAEALRGKDSTLQSKDFKIALDLMKAHLQQREQKLDKANRAAAEKWLAENKKKKGVVTTKSGLQYQVVKKGTGEVFKALKKGEVDTRRFLIRYIGMTLDGKVYERVGGDRLVAVSEQVMPGLKEALKRMPVGSTWKVFLKPNLAYGSRRVNALIAPGSGVMIEVSLEGIKKLEVRK